MTAGSPLAAPIAVAAAAAARLGDRTPPRSLEFRAGERPGEGLGRVERRAGPTSTWERSPEVEAWGDLLVAATPRLRPWRVSVGFAARRPAEPRAGSLDLARLEAALVRWALDPGRPSEPEEAEHGFTFDFVRGRGGGWRETCTPAPVGPFIGDALACLADAEGWLDGVGALRLAIPLPDGSAHVRLGILRAGRPP